MLPYTILPDEGKSDIFPVVQSLMVQQLEAKAAVTHEWSPSAPSPCLGLNGIDAWRIKGWSW